jgi:hypothetical protein
VQFGWDLNAAPPDVSASQQVTTAGDGLFINAPGADASMEVSIFGANNGLWSAPMPAQGVGMIPWETFQGYSTTTGAGPVGTATIQGVTININGGSAMVNFCFCVVDIRPYWL